MKHVCMLNSTVIRKSYRRWIQVLAVGAAAMVAPVLIAAGPVVTLSSDALTVTQLAPGSSLALISVAREPADYMHHIVTRQELLVDDDHDGEVRYSVPNGVAFSSIWIVVDIATGELVVASPQGFQPMPMRQRGLRRGKAVEANANTIDIGRTSAALLVVRPGVGAWRASAREALEAATEKKVGRRIGVDASKLAALGSATEKELHALQRGDVIVVLDPAMMQYWTKKLD